MKPRLSWWPGGREWRKKRKSAGVIDLKSSRMSEFSRPCFPVHQVVSGHPLAGGRLARRLWPHHDLARNAKNPPSIRSDYFHENCSHMASNYIPTIKACSHDIPIAYCDSCRYSTLPRNPGHSKFGACRKDYLCVEVA